MILPAALEPEAPDFNEGRDKGLTKTGSLSYCCPAGAGEQEILVLLRRVPLPTRALLESIKEQESLINWLHCLASGSGFVLLTVSPKSAGALRRTTFGCTSPACLRRSKSLGLQLQALLEPA